MGGVGERASSGHCMMASVGWNWHIQNGRHTLRWNGRREGEKDANVCAKLKEE